MLVSASMRALVPSTPPDGRSEAAVVVTPVTPALLPAARRRRGAAGTGLAAGVNASFTSAPAASSAFTASILPALDANSSGVKPPSVRARTSAPSSTSVRTTSPCPSAAAHIKAVCPCQLSRASIFAPFAASSLRISILPLRAAHHDGGFTFRHGAVGIGPGGEQRRHDGRTAGFAGEQQRRDAVSIRDLDVGAGLDQQRDDGGPVAAGRPSAGRSCRQVPGR